MEEKKSAVMLIGVGYVLFSLAQRLPPASLLGIVRREEAADALKKIGHRGIVRALPDNDLGGFFNTLNSSSVIIDSTPPLKNNPTAIAQCVSSAVPNHLREQISVIYLSATSVYGVDDGSWVTETTSTQPSSTSGKNRLAVEAWYRSSFKNVTSLRLSGIYGPGRGIGRMLKEGTYRYRDSTDRWSNRIHRDDIVAVLLKLLAHPLVGHEIVNISDDMPIRSSEMIKLYTDTFSFSTPPPITDGEIKILKKERLMDDKRISNQRMKSILQTSLLFPSLYQGIGEEFKVNDSEVTP